MNVNSELKNEGIIVKSNLSQKQIKKISLIISKIICESFSEHGLKQTEIYGYLSSLNMCIAYFKNNDSMAKYFYKTNTIYFSSKIDFKNIDTLVIHECIHAIQEIKSPNGKLVKLGLFNLSNNSGEGINEAAVQLMASKATNVSHDSVKYYGMSFETPSPLFYPIETALIEQIVFFTGTYPLYHSTLFSNEVFKNTLSLKTTNKVYKQIEKNFDLLIQYESQHTHYSQKLAGCNSDSQKANKLSVKINAIKQLIIEITLATQNLIIENCFNSEFKYIRDEKSITQFKQRLNDFKSLLISHENYHFYNNFFYEMTNNCDEKCKLLNFRDLSSEYIENLQKDLLDIQKDTFGLSFFKKLFKKLKLIFEEKLRVKSLNKSE